MPKIEEVDGLKEKIEALEKQTKSQEELIQKYKTEAGQVRATADEIKAIIGDKEAFQKIIDSVKAKSDNSGGKVQSTVGDEIDGGKTDASVEELVKKMTKDQKEGAKAKFLELKSSDRIIIKADPEKRIAFFKAAMKAVSAVPDSPFDDESESSEEDKFGFEALWKLANKEKNFVPGSRQIGASGFAGADGKTTQESTSKRLIGGKIPRPTPGAQPKE